MEEGEVKEEGMKEGGGRRWRRDSRRKRVGKVGVRKGLERSRQKRIQRVGIGDPFPPPPPPPLRLNKGELWKFTVHEAM